MKVCVIDQDNTIISDYNNMIPLKDNNIEEEVKFKNSVKIKKGFKLKLYVCLGNSMVFHEKYMFFNESVDLKWKV